MVKLVFNLFLKNCSRNMVQLTIEQRVFVVLHYTKTQSIAAVQNAFLERFPDRISSM